MFVLLDLFLVMLHYLDQLHQQLEWELIRGWVQVLTENLHINLAATFYTGIQEIKSGTLQQLLEAQHLIFIGPKMCYAQNCLLNQQSKHGVVVFGMTKL